MKRNKPRRREKATYENRYRHKLNMLWPGQTMLSITGTLLLIGILCELLNWPVGSTAAFALAGAVLAVLLILVAVELHQDRVQSEIAVREQEGQNRSR